MRYLYFYLLLILSLLSCQSEQKSKNNKLKNNKQKEVTFKISEPLVLSKEATTLVSNWKEYQNFKNLFSQYKNTTPSEAFSNAKELNTLAEQLKDSIRNKSLKTIPFNARLDVLQNETLRLKDMIDIPNLKNADIKEQIIKILGAYDATIAKLNNLAVQTKIEKELDKMIKDNNKDSSKIYNCIFYRCYAISLHQYIKKRINQCWY